MAADPVQRGGQAVPGRILVLSRHIAILRLLSLGYEHYDTRLPCLWLSGASY
jgi:hypothetical protein